MYSINGIVTGVGSILYQTYAHDLWGLISCLVHGWGQESIKKLKEFCPKGLPDSSTGILNGVDPRVAPFNCQDPWGGRRHSSGRVRDAKRHALTWTIPREKESPFQQPPRTREKHCVFYAHGPLCFSFQVTRKQLLNDHCALGPERPGRIQTTPPFQDLPLWRRDGSVMGFADLFCKCWASSRKQGTNGSLTLRLLVPLGKGLALGSSSTEGTVKLSLERWGETAGCRKTGGELAVEDRRASQAHRRAWMRTQTAAVPRPPGAWHRSPFSIKEDEVLLLSGLWSVTKHSA